MTANRPTRQRKLIRLKGWDYRNAGAYFVTICTYQSQCTLGRVVDGRMRLNSWGQIIVKTWRQIPEHFETVELDEFICMPNHVHMIIWILYSNSVDSRHALPLPPRELGVASGSLGAIVGSFKSAVTKEINLTREDKHPLVWQSRFHDRIVRNERELNAIRQYIRNNPNNWEVDHEWNEGLDERLSQM